MKLKIDFHVHSHKSFDSLMSYKEIVDQAKKRGLDGVCICDHACTDITESLAYDADDFIIIPAVEFTTGKNHIIGMFLQAEPKVEFDEKLHVPVQKIVEVTHENGGICILAHPFERLKEGEQIVADRMQELMHIMDGVEIYNSRAPYAYPQANHLAMSKADKLGIICRTAGSDAHLIDEIGGAYCVVDTPSRSLNDIKKAVLEGKTEFFGHQCKRIHVSQSEMIKARKNKRPITERIKIYLSYPVRAASDIKDIILKREL